MRHLTLITLIVFALNLNAQNHSLRYNIIFNSGKTTLTKEHKQQIIAIQKALLHGEKIAIYPLTTNKGKTKAPKGMSSMSNKNYYSTPKPKLGFAKNAKAQAESIAGFAKSLGFEVLGIPSNFPSAYSGVSVSVSLKHRVTRSATTPKESLAKTPEKEIIKPIKVKDHYPEKPSQFFTINPNRDTVIYGNEGTKLFFEAGSMLSDKAVEIELKEFYGIADYIKGDLLTVSNGRMIETGGSMYLNATEKENPQVQVQINKQKGVAVDFTLGKDDPEMKIFVKDPRSRATNRILPRTTKKSWRMTKTIMDHNGRVIETLVFNSKADWEAYLQREKRDEEIKVVTQNKMDSKLKVTNLGYINCDKFNDDPKIPIQLMADQKTPAEYYLIFKGVRGVMKGRKVSSTQIVFGSVPKGKKAVLMAVSFIGEQAYFYKADITLVKKVNPPIELKPVEESYLDEQMAMLK